MMIQDPNSPPIPLLILQHTPLTQVWHILQSPEQVQAGRGPDTILAFNKRCFDGIIFIFPSPSHENTHGLRSNRFLDRRKSVSVKSKYHRIRLQVNARDLLFTGHELTEKLGAPGAHPREGRSFTLFATGLIRTQNDRPVFHRTRTRDESEEVMNDGRPLRQDEG